LGHTAVDAFGDRNRPWRGGVSGDRGQGVEHTVIRTGGHQQGAQTEGESKAAEAGRAARGEGSISPGCNKRPRPGSAHLGLVSRGQAEGSTTASRRSPCRDHQDRLCPGDLGARFPHAMRDRRAPGQGHSVDPSPTIATGPAGGQRHQAVSSFLLRQQLPGHWPLAPASGSGRGRRTLGADRRLRIATPSHGLEAASRVRPAWGGVVVTPTSENPIAGATPDGGPLRLQRQSADASKLSRCAYAQPSNSRLLPTDKTPSKPADLPARRPGKGAAVLHRQQR